jgi:hypothetical protein
MSGSFDNVRFPETISYDAVGGVLYQTDVTGADSGAEGRKSVWTYGRNVWDVSHGVKTPAQIETLIEFYRARRGRLYAFRFKDWTDYTAAAGSPTLLINDVPSGDQTAIQAFGRATSLVVDTAHFPFAGNPTTGFYPDRYFYFVIPWGTYDAATMDITYTFTLTSTAGSGGPQIVFSTGNTTSDDHDSDSSPTVHTETIPDPSSFLLDAVNAVSAVAPAYRPLEAILRLEAWLGGDVLDSGTAEITSLVLNLHSASHQQRYQLLKRYNDGVMTDDRIIQAPISAITLLDGVSAASGASVDYSSGLVTISPPPSGTLTWSGTFDFPARFDTDEMQITADGPIQRWNGIPIIEVVVST